MGAEGVDPLGQIGPDGSAIDQRVLRSIVELCGRTDRARALPRLHALSAGVPAPATELLAAVLGVRARRLVVAVWTAGADPVFLDGAARLVPGTPTDLGPAVGRVLRRRREQGVEAWVGVAQAAGCELEEVVLVLGALVESLIDDLSGALDVERAVVERAMWGPVADAAG